MIEVDNFSLINQVLKVKEQNACVYRINPESESDFNGLILLYPQINYGCGWIDLFETDEGKVIETDGDTRSGYRYKDDAMQVIEKHRIQ